MVRRLKATEAWPVDGYLITCPYYSRPSQEGIFRHFSLLARAAERPVLVYNIPYRTGVNLANETLLRLAAEQRHIVGVKDCCADMAQSHDLLRRRPPGFAVLTGEDAQFFQAMAAGANGGILASAHAGPAAFAAVADAITGGRLPEARRLWDRLTDLVRLLFSEPNPAPIKHLAVAARPGRFTGAASADDRDQRFRWPTGWRLWVAP